MNKSLVLAKILLDEYWDYSLPINPIYYCNKLGIKVFSGENRIEKRNIYLDTTLSSQRQRYIVAQQLGHILLYNGIKEKNFGLSVLQNIEVNIFAGALLIPLEALKILIPMNLSFDVLCNRFDVIGEILNFRLKRLGFYL